MGCGRVIWLGAARAALPCQLARVVRPELLAGTRGRLARSSACACCVCARCHQADGSIAVAVQAREWVCGVLVRCAVRLAMPGRCVRRQRGRRASSPPARAAQRWPGGGGEAPRQPARRHGRGHTGCVCAPGGRAGSGGKLPSHCVVGSAARWAAAVVGGAVPCVRRRVVCACVAVCVRRGRARGELACCLGVSGVLG